MAAPKQRESKNLPNWAIASAVTYEAQKPTFGTAVIEYRLLQNGREKLNRVPQATN